MRAIHCMCGTALDGADFDTILKSLVSHVDEAHPGLGLTDQHLHDFVEVSLRPERPLERLAHIGPVELRPVGADILDDVLAFFDLDAFADNPGWARCYCVYPTTLGEEFMNRSMAANRADLAERVRTGRTRGWLAYVDGEPAAWVNATPRAEIEIDTLEDDSPDDKVGVISCFIVAARFRGHGIQKQLLDAAVRGFAEAGMVAVEGHPVKVAENDAGAFHGTVQLFTDAGFEVVSETENRAFVRKALA